MDTPGTPSVRWVGAAEDPRIHPVLVSTEPYLGMKGLVCQFWTLTGPAVHHPQVGDARPPGSPPASMGVERSPSPLGSCGHTIIRAVPNRRPAWERGILARALTPKGVQHFSNAARRIAPVSPGTAKGRSSDCPAALPSYDPFGTWKQVPAERFAQVRRLRQALQSPGRPGQARHNRHHDLERQAGVVKDKQPGYIPALL